MATFKFQTSATRGGEGEEGFVPVVNGENFFFFEGGHDEIF
jgi:hypothetical protein